MNKKNRLLLIVVVVTLMLGIAVTATAGPDFCDEKSPKYNPNHPTCSDTPDPEPEPPTLAACTTEMTIPGKGDTSFECLWTPVEPGEGESTVAKVTVSGLERGVTGPPVVFVRDDSPGDICLLEQDWVDQTGPVYVASFDLVYGDSLPLGYEAWEGQSYWGFVWQEGMEPGTHWCAPQDFVLDSLRFDTNGTPLHFMVNFNARGGGQLTINLYPGQR